MGAGLGRTDVSASWLAGCVAIAVCWGVGAEGRWVPKSEDFVTALLRYLLDDSDDVMPPTWLANHRAIERYEAFTRAQGYGMVVRTVAQMRPILAAQAEQRAAFWEWVDARQR